MKKRILSYLLVLCMSFGMMNVMPLVSHAASINIGDYILMGTYYGEPILWRCVDIDENGPLILSDKILCIKPFDAAGDNGSHTRDSDRSRYGSNYWKDSNMRSWLNSNAPAGKVKWLCGNPPIESKVLSGYNEYDQEAGFLTNFTSKEINAMKLVTQKSLVSYPESDKEIYDMGRERHTYNNSISSCVQNYNRAYAEYVTDRMFLLDVKQINKVYQNSNVLGNNYYGGKSTQQCVQNSEYKDSNLNVNSYWYYWLRSPYALSYNYVRYVNSGGFVSDYSAYYSYLGVRPAFYLNLQSAIFKSGRGTESNPYTISIGNIPVTSISLDQDTYVLKIGDRKQLKATFYPNNATYENITWSSSNSKVATVDKNGVVKAIKKGSTFITVRSDNGVQEDCKVIVDETYYTEYKYGFYNAASSFYPYYMKDGEEHTNYMIPLGRYKQAGFTDSKSYFLYSKSGLWGGNCFGMSASSILFYKDVLQEERYDPNVHKPKEFSAPRNDDGIKLRFMIELFQVSQNRSDYNRFYDFKTLINELDNDRPVLLMLTKFIADAHAVVISDYDIIDGKYVFHIYDSSLVMDKLVLDNDGYRLYKGDNISVKYEPKAFISFQTIKNVYESIKNENKNGAISLFSLGESIQYTYIVRPAENMTLINSEGKTSTIINGDISGDIEDIQVIPSSYLAENPTYTIIAPTDTYTIIGSGDETVTTSFADDYMSAEVTAKASTSITVSSDLRKIEVENSDEAEYSITYTTYDNIFDEMTLTGIGEGVISTELADSDVIVTGAKTIRAKATVSEAEVITEAENLNADSELTVRCEENESNATIQILSNNTELTEKETLPERLRADSPEYDLQSGEYSNGQILNFTKDDETVIYYTTDGSEPSESNGIIYSLPIEINKSMTIKAVSTKYGYDNSEIVELTYKLPKIAAPYPSYSEGEYDSVITTELLAADEDVEMYYTMDGSDPLENGILYTIPLVMDRDTVIKAYAMKDGCISDVVEYEYKISSKFPFYFSNTTVNQNGEIITKSNLNELTGVLVTASKLQSGEKSGMFVVAFYDENDKLISVKFKEETVSEDVQTIEIQVDADVTGANKVKVFAWDSKETMKPASEIQEQILIEVTE